MEGGEHSKPAEEEVPDPDEDDLDDLDGNRRPPGRDPVLKS